ncbi:MULTISPECIES: MerR family transcriptional regulator [unclassified Knoellia]|uniref:MerR family transcriptional regulator n=1 Tax=Knoellia altitudinis TaxID=3404795 RepID=UPI00361AD2A5
MAKSARPPADPSSGVAGDKGVYSISVAAELVGTGAQNLRLYEARGLLEPDRTDGGTRRYSEEDIVRLQRIGQLLEDGLNLAGIGQMLELEAENADLRRQNAALRSSRDQDRRPPRA